MAVTCIYITGTLMRNFFLGFVLAWTMIVVMLMSTYIPEYTVITQTVCV